MDYTRGGNVFWRSNGPMDKDQCCPNHEHNFDHLTVCVYGAVRVVKLFPSGERQELVIRQPHPDYDGPSEALIEAGIKHEITALVDRSMFRCFYAHRNAQGEVVQKYEGFERAYATWHTPA